MGFGGGLLLVTIQALLADHHGELRAIALTEANVAASVAYVVLIGALSLAAATGAGWRVALLASLVGPAARVVARPRGWRSTRRRRRTRSTAALPGVFWIAAAMLFCTTAAEWCITAWGASFVEDAADVSADTAVALMVGYFGGVVAGRALGSRLARRHAAAAAARARARGHRRRVRDPVAVDAARRRRCRPGGARDRARQPVPARALGDRRARAGAGAAGERPRGAGDVVRGAARAADGRHAGGRDLADRRAAVVPVALALAARSGLRRALLDEVEAAGRGRVEPAGAPAAHGVADERRGALAVAAHDRRPAAPAAVLGGGDRSTRTRRRS